MSYPNTCTRCEAAATVCVRPDGIAYGMDDDEASVSRACAAAIRTACIAAGHAEQDAARSRVIRSASEFWIAYCEAEDLDACDLGEALADMHAGGHDDAAHIEGEKP